MNCPKCNYPNQSGATYCGLCYEVLNRSAADAYLRNAARERLQAQRDRRRVEHPLQDLLDRTANKMNEIDWHGIGSAGLGIVRRFKRPILWAGGSLAILGLLFWITTSTALTGWAGHRLTFAFSSKTPAKYLVSFHQDVRSWSERQGQMDTPLGDVRTDELANLSVEAAKAQAGRREKFVGIRPLEWIEIVYHGDKGASRQLPLTHPTLAPATVMLDRSGIVLQRYVPLSPRLAKSVDFILPSFPKERLRVGSRWKEPVRWLETLGPWQVLWSGEFQWTLAGDEVCGQDSCVHLSYRAVLRPSLRQAPGWAVGAIGAPRFEGTAEGDALYVAGRERLYANSLRYQGLLRIPLFDIGRIPKEIRIGRRVRGMAGQILLQINNRIDIRKT